MARRTPHLALAALAAAATLAPAAPRAAPPAPAELTLVSYAVAKPVFARLIPEFQRAWRAQTGARILFALPGLVLATVVVTLPCVAREVLPALYQLDRAEEEAAHVLGATRWQTFRRVVVPAVRASVLYGVVLCTARAAGEFGAVSVVSGKLIGETNTLTLHIERAYAEYETVPAFAAATLLTTVGLFTVAADTLWRRRRHA